MVYSVKKTNTKNKKEKLGRSRMAAATILCKGRDRRSIYELVTSKLDSDIREDDGKREDGGSERGRGRRSQPAQAIGGGDKLVETLRRTA